jgi:hypothetical protein
MTDEATEDIQLRLTQLRIEHRDLDAVLDRLGAQPGYDQLLMGRLKKRKLMLKDQIQSLESGLIPNIIA